MMHHSPIRLLARNAFAAIAITGLVATSAFSNERSEHVARAVEKISLVSKSGTMMRSGTADLRELLQQAREIPAFKADPATVNTFRSEASRAIKEGKDRVPDQYLVVMKSEYFPIQYTSNQIKGRRLLSADGILAEEFAEHMVNEVGGVVYDFYQNTRPTIAANLTEQQMAKLEKHPLVEYIAPNGIVRVSSTWGLDRTDQRNLPLDNSYLPEKTGAGVHVYVFDSGIRATHQEFAGRIGSGEKTSYNSTNDGSGHGTHVSGTIAGASLGVAPQATIHPVKVLNDDPQPSGSIFDIQAGINWAIGDHNTRNQSGTEPIPAVANLSLGVATSSTVLDDLVQDLIDAGVTVVVSAGNSSEDASNISPARVPAAITVGATSNSDSFASFSNFGPVLDILAPGVSITSAGIASDSDDATLSGTSMAAPHVAGVAALHLQDAPHLTPAQISQLIVNESTSNKITGLIDNPSLPWDNTRDETPNRLLYIDEYDGSPVAQPSGAWLQVDQANGQVNLFWTDESVNEIKFQIERSSDLVNYQVVGEPFANQESFSEAIPGGSFFYRIRAVGQAATVSSYALFGSIPPSSSGSETLSETASPWEYIYESLEVEVPSGSTASGATSVFADSDAYGWAYAEANIQDPGGVWVASCSAQAAFGTSESDSDSFSNGSSGTYILEIICESENDYLEATAEATLSWE